MFHFRYELGVALSKHDQEETYSGARKKTPGLFVFCGLLPVSATCRKNKTKQNNPALPVIQIMLHLVSLTHLCLTYLEVLKMAIRGKNTDLVICKVILAHESHPLVLCMS